MKIPVLTALAITLLGGFGAAHAENLLDVYRMATQNDPQYRAAAAAHQAALEAKPQSRAVLLPQINAGASTARNRQKTSGSTTFANTTSFYDTDGYSISLTQPVYHHDLLIQLGQADSRIAQADAVYADAEQSLILRVAERYFDVLAARDSLEFAQSEKQAIARQLEQAQERFEVGLIAITDVHEAQARYDLAKAQEIVADNVLATSRESLREIVGAYIEDLNALGESTTLARPDPDDVEAWVKAAMDANLQLAAAQAATDTAKAEIGRQRAGHLPSVDLVANHTYSDVGGGNFGGRESEDSSIALELNVPLYAGGLVNSRTREAAQLYNQSREQHEQVKRAVERQTRDAYIGMNASISTVEALKQALVSSQIALEAAEAGNEVGTRTIVDVLDAQSKLFAARRDYARARYDYLLNTLRLKQAAGRLAAGDIEQINRRLAP